MSAFTTETVVVTYLIGAVYLLIFVVIAAKIFTNNIDVSSLLSEPTGKASLSRFQMLIFTMVIAGLYLVLSIENGQLIDVPNGALLLLGISGGSYLISKGIGANANSPLGSQTTAPDTSSNPTVNVNIHSPTATAAVDTDNIRK